MDAHHRRCRRAVAQSTICTGTGGNGCRADIAGDCPTAHWPREAARLPIAGSADGARGAEPGLPGSSVSFQVALPGYQPSSAAALTYAFIVYVVCRCPGAAPPRLRPVGRSVADRPPSR